MEFEQWKDFQARFTLCGIVRHAHGVWRLKTDSMPVWYFSIPSDESNPPSSPWRLWSHDPPRFMCCWVAAFSMYWLFICLVGGRHVLIEKKKKIVCWWIQNDSKKINKRPCSFVRCQMKEAKTEMSRLNIAPDEDSCASSNSNECPSYQDCGTKKAPIGRWIKHNRCNISPLFL